MGLLAYDVPWQELVEFANTLLQNPNLEATKFNDVDTFPSSEKSILRPLTEDFLLRGLEMTKGYFPKAHWAKNLDEEERLIELPSMGPVRVERILWLTVRIAKIGSWIDYDESARRFSVAEAYTRSLDLHNAAVRAREARPVSRHDDSDVEMQDSVVREIEDDDTGDEATSEARELVNKQRELKQRIMYGPMDEDEKEKPAKQAPPTPLEDMVRPNYTVVTPDTNALIKMPGTFYAMLNSPTPWKLVIPYSVVTELAGLIKNERGVSTQAKYAESMLDQAVSEKKSVKVVTAKGHVVPNIKAHFKESIDFSASKNLDDIILSTARDEGANVEPRQGYEGVKTVVLVTDDGLLRVKAHSAGVMAVSTKEWTYALAKMPEDGQLKRKSMPPVPATPVIGPKKRIKAEGGAGGIEVG